MDLQGKLTTIFAAAGAGLVFSRAVHAAVAPGPLRFLLFLPVVVVNCVLPATLLDPFEEGVILTGLVCANFGWWCNFKLLAYSLDRGQLMRAQNSPLLVWLMVAAMPMRIDENNQPASASPSEAAAAKEGSDYKKKKRSGSSVGPGPRVKEPSRRAWWTRFLGKLLMISAAVLLEPHLPPGPNDLRHLIFAFGIIYAVLGCIFDVTAAFAARAFGLTLAPHFDKPFLSTSATDIWARRWNLVVGTNLRDLVYAPIVEGRWLGGDAGAGVGGGPTVKASTAVYGDPIARPSAARRLTATTACFLASGLMHEVLICWVTGRTAPTWEWTAYFTLQAPLVVFERWVTRQTRVRLPAVVMIPVTMGVQLVLARAFFFPPMVRTKLDERVLEDLSKMRLPGMELLKVNLGLLNLGLPIFGSPA